MQKKPIVIADTIHHSIPISDFEMGVISTPVFNRLHNVLQNSTVYLTFPCSQTKRFSHSLGTMHLSGKIFYYSILNAKEKVRYEFLEKSYKEIDNIIKEKLETENLNHYLGDYTDLMEDYKNIIINEPLFISNTPSNIKKDQLSAYQILYQAIRLASLLHDIGHPPFSHTLEDSLNEIRKKIEKNKKQTERQKLFCKTMEKYEKQNNSGEELHEQIGYVIIGRLLDSLLVKANPSNKEEAEIKILDIISYWIVLEIFNKNDDRRKNGISIFSDLHYIFSSAFDSDRLDYVERDLENSGFHIGRNNYDRLICLMKLMKNKNNFIFCPSIRTLSNIEELFSRRMSLYKFVIYHHRVVKTDYLFKQTLIALSMEYLNSSENKTSIPYKSLLSLGISVAWEAINDVYSNKKYFDILTQWDDSLILSTFRYEYFTKYMNMHNKVSYKLEELITNKKNYRSIIKRMNNFKEIDNKVMETINIDWEKLIIFHGEYKNIINIIDNLSNQFDRFQKKTAVGGFFLIWFSKLLNSFAVLKEKKDIMDFEHLIKKALTKTLDKYECIDYIIDFKNLSTGLDQTVFVHEEDKVVKLEDVSQIGEELNLKQLYFPPFFIYIMEKESNKIPKSEFLCDLGKQIGKEINKLIKKIIK